MKTTSFTKRITAFVLTLFMVVGLMPGVTKLTVSAAQAGLVISDKRVDGESFESWKDYYGTNSILPDGTRGISTWKAGGVWTDKSVYADTQKFPSSVIMNDQTNNFLVALSAIASNKEIVGQSTNPTDTFMVLDVSGSMDSNSKASGMVEAANRAIHALLSQNRNNRLGVILYSGTRNDNGATATTLLLPLDHYTTSSTVNVGSNRDPEYIPQYITLSNDYVSIASGVLNSSGSRPESERRQVTGATYIQRGLYDSWLEFAKVTDIKIPAGNVQAGVQRKPVVILMSDGRPTLASEDYNDVTTRDYEHGNGSDDTTTWATVFLTQLTAAYVKGAIGDHYGTDVLFYSLGLGTSNDTYATSVLNPSTTNNSDVLHWWEKFVSGTERNDGTVEVQEYVDGSGRPGWPGYVEEKDAWYLDYDNDGFAKKVGRSYVDSYWSAADVEEMVGAFGEIIDEIGLQSAYSATLVESEAHLDGYITVQDELGSMMQVKDVKGILIGTTLFSGKELANSLNEGELGGVGDATPYGNEFVATVRERIGVTTSEAQQLIQAAWLDGQLSYNEQTGEYSNYIGWYGDENNAFLGFWDKDTGITSVGAPDGAKYINRSYGYLGEAHSSDMMHVVVMVHTEIATGHQTVLFRIPASLIPMVQYKVEIEGDSLETATSVSLDVVENEPIRLLYEVGLYDGINNINIDAKVEEYLAQNGANHVHKKADGSYDFYANGWDDDHDENAPDISSMSDAQKAALVKHIAESHFVPNTQNERYYVQENSTVYTKNGNTYTPVTSGISAGTDYYFARTIVTVANGTPAVQTQYEFIHPKTVSKQSNFEKNAQTGYYEIKAGTVRQQLTDLVVEKELNVTETLPDSDHLWVNVTGDESTDFNVYSFLGNNGRFTIVPATGIKVTKELAELASGSSADERFDITVTVDTVVPALIVTDVNGTDIEDYTARTVNNSTVITVALADGESAVITGLPADVTYTVTEAPHSKYSYTYEGASVTVASVIAEGVVTNTPVVDGGLAITKEVLHANGGMSFPTDEEFDIEVTFTDENGSPLKNKEFAIENDYRPELTKLTTDENGVIKGSLRHGETALIKNIPAGTSVTVKEVNVPAAYLKANVSPFYSSINKSGDTPQRSFTEGKVTIESGKNATIEVFNTYTPDPVSVNITFDGTKNFDASDMSVDAEFTFVLKEYVNGSWSPVEDKTITVTKGQNASVDFDFTDLELEFTEPGTHSYRIEELIGSDPNITYDRSVYTFTANVTIDANGKLALEVVGHNTEEDVFEVEGDVQNGYNVTTVFTNQYHTTATHIEVEKTVDDKAGTGKTPAGFVIEAYLSDENWTLGAKHKQTVTDAQGKARFVRNYDNTDFLQNDTDGDGVVKYYFIIKEANDGATGWKYDPTEYRVTVTLTKDPASAEISSDFDIVKVNGQDETDLGVNGDRATISFENVYEPKAAEIDLDVVPTVNKVLNGRDLEAGEFTFAVFEDGGSSFTDTSEAIMLGKNLAAESGKAAQIVFESTEYGIRKGLVNRDDKLVFSAIGKYNFDIVEIKGNAGGIAYSTTIYDLTVEVTEQNGTLTARHYFVDGVGESVAFTNNYSAEPTSVVIEGTKSINVISGTKSLTADMFKFGLYDETGALIDETANLANGSFMFDAVEYGFADIGKTFTYTVKEIAPDGTTDGSYKANGMSYSAQSFEVSVTVKDNGDGTLSAEVTGNGENNIGFVNNYESKLASATFNGKKKLENRTLTAGEFEFALYTTDSSFADEIAIVKQGGNDTVTHNAKGDFTVSVSGLTPGYHYFILREVIPAERAEGIGYDASEYQLTVNVSDNGSGQMHANTFVKHTGKPNEQDPAIEFVNVFTPSPDDIEVDINIIKNVINKGTAQMGPDGFEFVLDPEEDGVTNTVKVSDEDGKAGFKLTFTEEDIGKLYTYEVTETDKGAEHVTYDDTKYTVTVAVSLNNEGQLEAELTVNGDEADEIVLEFENIYDYTPKASQTNDNSRFGLWMVLLTVCGGAILTLAAFDKRKTDC